MDAVAAVQARARHDVAALEHGGVPTTRMSRDFEVGLLMRQGRRVVRRTMREAGTLRPWWDRVPLLLVGVPLTVVYALVFGEPFAGVAAAVVLAWGAVTEPRWNRAERRERHRLLTAYRNAVADALDARTDRFVYGWGEDEWARPRIDRGERPTAAPTADVRGEAEGPALDEDRPWKLPRLDSNQ